MSGEGARPPIPVLEGRRIRLVPFDLAYIGERYLSWLRHPETGRYLEKAGPGVTLEDVESFCRAMIASPDDYFFAILEREGMGHIGNVRLGPVDWEHGTSDFGLMIGDREYQGRGLGGECVALIKSFAFGALQLTRMGFAVVRAHEAAMALYHRHGFTLAGPADKRFVKGGHSLEMVRFVLDHRSGG